jgi:hypothetical protein
LLKLQIPTLQSIELGLRLKHIEGCVQRGRARRIPGALVVLLAQPGLKTLARSIGGISFRLAGITNRMARLTDISSWSTANITT